MSEILALRSTLKETQCLLESIARSMLREIQEYERGRRSKAVGAPPGLCAPECQCSQCQYHSSSPHKSSPLVEVVITGRLGGWYTQLPCLQAASFYNLVYTE